MEFRDAEYIAPKGGPGKTAEPNPYTDIVSQIALKLNAKGKPVAKVATLTHENADARKTDIAKAKRQLSQAGEKNDPLVTVPSVDFPVKLPIKGKKFNPEDETTYTLSDTQTEVTFWTVKRQTRPRKPVATDEQLNAAASQPVA